MIFFILCGARFCRRCLTCGICMLSRRCGFKCVDTHGMSAQLLTMYMKVQEHKPELCSWLQSNFLSSLNEDGFAHAVVCVANIPHISAFTSLVLAHNRSIATLPSLLSLLHNIASTRSSAAASFDSLKATKRNFAVASKSDPTTELCFNQDQAYLKACCVVIALAQFDISRFFGHFSLNCFVICVPAHYHV
jgi:hypothetical protein